MAYTIITNTCEGITDCVDAYPVACIYQASGKNAKGTKSPKGARGATLLAALFPSPA